MEKAISMLFLTLLLGACQREVERSSVDPVNWDKRTIRHGLADSLVHGSTYLSVYSQIYSQTEHTTHALTVTVSMRNTSSTDTVYINRAEYFDTHGRSVHTYFDKTIFIAPMETVEIVIDERDKAGGTGGNFLFDWSISPQANEPLFEGIMISTSGQQGLSFATQGRRIH